MLAPVLLSVLFGFPLFLIRAGLLRRTTHLADTTNLPEWKAWRLSVLEPIITTAIALVCAIVMIARLSLHGGFILLPMLNMMLFALLIRWRGQGCQRGRLANTIIFARLALLCIPLFFIEEIGMAVTIPLLIPPLALRALFGLYQDRVTPTLVEYEKGNAAIKDGLDEHDLWDEPGVLIERLKGEEGMVDPLIAEKNITVGRARELL